MSNKEIQELRNIEDVNFNAYRLRVIDGLNAQQKNIAIKKVEKAIKTGDISDLNDMVNTPQIQFDFGKVDGKFEEVFVESGKVASRYIPIVSGGDFFFSAENKRISNIFKNITAERVTLIDESVKAVLKTQIKEAYGVGRPARKTAKLISQNVGMTERDSIGYINLRKNLEEQGLKQSVIDSRLSRYKNDAIKRRAKTIARTELSRATNEAQVESWKQADEQDLMPKGMRKQWFAIGDERTSEVCNFLNGKKVEFTKMFESPFGDFNNPPAHVNCRSGISLVV